MTMLRFFAPLAIILCLIAYFMLPWTDRLFLSWSETDLRIRSGLVFSSIKDGLSEVLNAERGGQLTKKFTELAKDERLVGIGYCDGGGAPKYRNKDFPSDINCPDLTTYKEPYFSRKTIKGGSVLVAIFPISGHEGDINEAEIIPKSNYLMIVHDMAYAELRGDNTRFYVLGFLIGISLLAAFITLLVARLTMSKWMLGLRDYVRTGKRSHGLPREALGITREIQKRMRQLEREQQRASLIGTQWSAETLFALVRNNLPSEQIITVSYRQPYTHSKSPDGLVWNMPASGLVTAIEPIMKACRGTWIAVASGDADKLVVDSDDALMVPPENPVYRLKRIWLSEAEEAGFYAGFSNEGLWPLCNMAYVKPRFRAADWEAYKSVNRKFADSIVAEAKSDSPIVFIQDYHFGLLPRMVRERLPGALIVVFWHIPWPNSETLGILPCREEFLAGMLASDIVGFHTQYFCNNFLDCIDTHVEGLIDREHDTVRHGDDFCMVMPYPISIAWPDFDSMSLPSVTTCRNDIAAMLGIDKDAKIILGVERLDYIKGIPERLRAFGVFLEDNPEFAGRIHFVQIASPSRSIIPAYADIDREVDKAAELVNKKHGTSAWTPIHVLKRNFNQREVYRFFRAADVCVVSSLHDGMNLVAKEFVAARDDNRGVLILSQFSGSSRELVDAIIVNPYDELGLSRSLSLAVSMGEDEQSVRMKSMRDHVKSHNVFAWAARILGDAARLHNRRRLNKMLREGRSVYDSTSTTENVISWPLQLRNK